MTWRSYCSQSQRLEAMSGAAHQRQHRLRRSRPAAGTSAGVSRCGARRRGPGPVVERRVVGQRRQRQVADHLAFVARLDCLSRKSVRRRPPQCRRGRGRLRRLSPVGPRPHLRAVARHDDIGRARTGVVPRAAGGRLVGPFDGSQPAACTGDGYRPINEVGNNVANPTLGTAGTDLLRVSPAAYADGVSAPSLAEQPQRPRRQRHPQQPGGPREPVAGPQRPSTRRACPTSATPSGSSSTTTWT